MKYATFFASVLVLSMGSAFADGLIENDPSLRASSFPTATTMQQSASDQNHPVTVRAYASTTIPQGAGNWSNSVALPFDPAYGRSGGDNK